MRMYFLFEGIFGIAYYLILAVYSKKWNSTFAGFWLVTGGAHFILWCAPLSSNIKKGIFVICLCGWALFLLVEACIFRTMKSSCTVRVDYLIVLGAQVRGRKITNSLLRRLNTALSYLRVHTDTMVIVSGGQGPGEEITEAQAMAEYLYECGIAKERILKEEKSTTTRENLRYSRQLIKSSKDTVCIVTNDFHLYRALAIGRQEGYQNLAGIAADSNPIFQLNYLVREFFAVLALWCFGKIRLTKGRRML